MDLNWKLTDKDIFHVHSFRCGHAEDVSDEAYIKKAIELGAESIWFSDHAPFPGDYFRGRMRLDQLDEYISTLSDLKEKNKDKIAVHIGLEIEYLPSFDKAGYYAELKDKEGLEFFLLGQHFAEDPDDPGKYTFEWEKDRVEEHEFEVMGKAIVEGVIPKIQVSTGEESSGSGTVATQGLRPGHQRERNLERPPSNYMETGLS